MRDFAETEAHAIREAGGGSSPTRYMRANECLEEVTRGIGPGWKGRPLYGATRGGIALAKEPVGKNPARYKPVEPGAVFYNPMRILLQSIAMVDDGDAGGITSPDYVVVRGRPGILHHRVFYYWLRSAEGEAFIRELARGGVRERILFNRLCEGRIPVAPWPVQERLARQLAIVPRARAAAIERLAAAEALPAAYLRRFLNVDERNDCCMSLGEVAHIEMGQSPPGSSYNGRGEGAPLLNGPTEFGADHPVAVQWTTEPTRFASEGDILFCVRGATTGRKCRADKSYCIGRGLAALRGREGAMDTEYLFYMLDVVKDRLLAKAAGSTFVNLPGAEIEAAIVPVPPLADQRRIAGELSRRLAEAERLAARIREELAAIEALPAALLREAFGGGAVAGGGSNLE